MGQHAGWQFPPTNPLERRKPLARHLLADMGQGRYFNWDYDEDRRAMLQKRWSVDDGLLVFDELHKYPRWKAWVKGLHDVAGDLHRILVTVGGFPEPFLTNDLRESRRWRKERFDRVLQEDIRDLESIKNIQQLRLFLDLLRTRVGGMVVLSNLAGDIQVAPQTAKAWLEALERMYVLFRVLPYSQNIGRALIKPPKVYFFDNGDVPDEEGRRFENLIDDVLEELVEVKYSDEELSPALLYYNERLRPARATQIVATLDHAYDRDSIRITNPYRYFADSVPWLNNAPIHRA